MKIEEVIEDEEIKEDVKEVLDEPIQEVVSEDTPGTTLPRVEDKEPIELTEEEVASRSCTNRRDCRRDC